MKILFSLKRSMISLTGKRDLVHRSTCFYFLLMILFLPRDNYAQVLRWEPLCKLSSSLKGTSGLASINGGASFWSLADNNSPEELYELDTMCRILRTLRVAGIDKRDWEDLSADDSGNLYIGDFGNNANERKDLRILILHGPERASGDSIIPEIIRFRYANQREYPPPVDQRNFDMEAMVWFDDSLHLFSKNRTEPFSGICYHYVMPAHAGDYDVSPVDSFRTGPGPMLFYWITGAALAPSPGTFALLSHDRLWLFDDYPGSRFLQGRIREIRLPVYTQKEAICAIDAKNWFVTDEYNDALRSGGQLYRLHLGDATDVMESPDGDGWTISTDLVNRSLALAFSRFDDQCRGTWVIEDLNGHRLLEFAVEQAFTRISAGTLSRGLYLVRKRSQTWGAAAKRFFWLAD
jgi:hypothetical protein